VQAIWSQVLIGIGGGRRLEPLRQCGLEAFMAGLYKFREAAVERLRERNTLLPQKEK